MPLDSALVTPAPQPARIDIWARISVIGLFALAVIYTLSVARELLLPIFLAVFLGFIFRPIVRRLKRAGIPAVLTAAVILVVTLGAFALAVTMLREPATEWLDRVPSIVQRLEHKLRPLRQTIEHAREASEDLQRVAQGSGTSTQKVVVEDTPLLQRVVGYTLSTVVQVIVTLTLFFFLLAQGGAAVSGRLGRLLSWRHVDAIEQAVDDIESRVSIYLGTLALINLGVGICTALAMLALGVPNPLLWGVIAALLGPMPYVGPMLTIAILLVVGFTSFEDTWMILAPAGAYLVINQIESEIVTPVVQGRALQLSPVGVLLSIMMWTWLWGAIGALLAVPILVAATVIFDHVTKRHPKAPPKEP